MEYRFPIVLVIILNGNIMNVYGQAGSNDPEIMAQLAKQQQGQPTTLSAAGAAADRYVHASTTLKTKRRRTTPQRVSLEENCDYLAYYCLRAYKTGKLCARTMYYKYHNFKNYCMMDYVNCMERYEVWQVVHMGECFELKPLVDYQHYEYHDDLFLDQVYVIED